MKKMNHLIGLCTLLLVTFSANANETYSIQYAKSSPIKSIPLKNATLVLELYEYENPAGYVHVKTNDSQSFSLKHGQDFEVVGIIGEKKYKAMCSGDVTSTGKKIKITCVAN